MRFVKGLVAAAVLAVPAYAMDSGPAKGTGVAPFHVNDVTGKHAGESVCYRCMYGNNPVVAVFAREINDKVIAACTELDKAVTKKPEMKAFFVYIHEDADKAAAELKKIAADKGIKKLPLTVFVGKEGPEEYKLNKDAGVTVIGWNKGKVAMSKGYKTGAFCDGCAKTCLKEFASSLKPVVKTES